MSKKWKTIVASAVLAAAVAASGTAAYMGQGKTDPVYASAAWSDPTVEDVKPFGTKFTVPERTVTVDGNAVTASAVVIKPDGSATTEKEVTLDVSGVYTVVYTATVNGKPYVDEVTFRVDDAAYVLSSSKSSATYGKYQYSESASGVMVRLAYGDSITFNTPIDVKDATKSDVLVEAFATPDVKGVKDFDKLIFTFTDIENPNIYLRFTIRQSAEGDNYPISYALAGGNGQPMAGWEEYWKRLHIDNEWGAQFRHSFSLSFASNYAYVAPDKAVISLRYDAATLQSYVGGFMIIDHDNPAYFNNLWRGFPSGRAKLTISADMYNGDYANFCVSKLMGANLTDEKYVDNEAPVITVDTEYTEMPATKVGAEYKVPAATAYDSLTTSDCKVRTSVWYNYASSNAVLVQVRDGKFTADRAGDYAIVYETEDRLGNAAREIRWVHAYATLGAPNVAIAGDHVTTATVGEIVNVPEVLVDSYSGNATVAVTATMDGETISVTGGSFRPEKAGTYRITFTATDYIGQTGTASYDLTANMGDKPVFVTAPVLPKMLVEGCDYTLPEATAIDYRSGSPVGKKATVTVTDKNGTRAAVGGKINVAADNNLDTATVVYECEGASLTYELPIIKAMIEENGRPRLHAENYLVGSGFTTEKTDDSFILTATENNGGFTFGNRLVAENSAIELRGVAAASNFDAIEVTFADAEDEGKAVTARLIRTTGKADVTLCGQRTGLDNGFVTSDKFSLNYTQGIMIVDKARLDVTTYDDGSAFEGFPSGRIYISVRFVNASAGAQISLVSVNGHPMTTATSDRIAPKIVIMGVNYGGTHEIGSTITLPAAMAGDTLDPNVTFTMKVTDGSGKVVTDVDGVKLNGVDPGREYTIKLDGYGQYSVSYTATDTFNQRNNTRPLNYTINVVDEIAPEIKFEARFADTVKVGESIVIPKFTVTDNVSAAEDITITRYVLTPSGVLVSIPENSNSVKAVRAGKYEFRIIAVDKAGNVAMERVTVTAVAE